MYSIYRIKYVSFILKSMFISAADDFANSNAIHLAREADRHGERTIGVLTKIDIVPTGSYKEKIIEFSKKHKCLKYIGVKNSPNTKMEVSWYSIDLINFS